MVSDTTNKEVNYFYATGKRKSAIAKVRIYPSKQRKISISINERHLEDFFPLSEWQKRILVPFTVVNLENKFDIVINVHGGGVMGQLEAIVHGISKALRVYDENFKTILRKNGFITRDSRVKESKKYGLKRARKAPQYTKR